MKHVTKAGFLYVLTHPAEQGVHKIGVTIQKVEERLRQHNTNFSEATGEIVKETRQKWELKEYHSVPDIYYAESEFWAATGIADLPYRNGIEIFPMEEKILQIGLSAALKAGVRPPPKKPKLVHNREWMIDELEGSGITLVGKKFNHIQYTEFQCEKGHVFKAIPRVLANHKYCPLCNSE